MSKPASKIQHAFAKAKDRTRAMAQSPNLRTAFAGAAAGGVGVTFFSAGVVSVAVTLATLPLVPGYAAAALICGAGSMLTHDTARAVYNRFKK